MARVKRYLDIDVLTAARERMAHVYAVFDSVVVMFSGGKDSLCCLELAREAAEAAGRLPVRAVFRDEELIPQSVLDVVEHYRSQPWCDLLYMAVPLDSRKYILGKSMRYVQWDPARRWIRPKPAHAFTLPAGDGRVFDQHAMDGFTSSFYRGRIAFVTGIRASESLMRYRGVVNKLNENYITRPTKPTGGAPPPENVRLVKPIYDWDEHDVLKFIDQAGLKLADTYEHQLFAGQQLRVSTPLHAEASKKFHLLRLTEPALYAQVIDTFPEMLAHERYFAELDRNAMLDEYGDSWDGIERYIEEFIPSDAQPGAIAALQDVRPRADRYPAAYPLRHILRAFVNGTYKRKILPLSEQSRR